MTPEPSITCPRCGSRSYSLNDIAEGYCGLCHDWTSEPQSDAARRESLAGRRAPLIYTDADRAYDLYAVQKDYGWS